MTQHRAAWYVGAGVALVAVGFSVPGTGAPVESEAAVAAVAASADVAEAIAPVAAVAEAAVAKATAAEAPAAAEAEPAAEPARAAALAVIEGSASYYADKFEGRRTASGVPFRQAELWAAHKKYPFGTRLRVTNLRNGNEVEVEVVDRGPYAHGRILDLSKTAARRLDFIRSGHTRVKIEVLEWGG